MVYPTVRLRAAEWNVPVVELPSGEKTRVGLSTEQAPSSWSSACCPGSTPWDTSSNPVAPATTTTPTPARPSFKNRLRLHVPGTLSTDAAVRRASRSPRDVVRSSTQGSWPESVPRAVHPVFGTSEEGTINVGVSPGSQWRRGGGGGVGWWRWLARIDRVPVAGHVVPDVVRAADKGVILDDTAESGGSQRQGAGTPLDVSDHRAAGDVGLITQKSHLHVPATFFPRGLQGSGMVRWATCVPWSNRTPARSDAAPAVCGSTMANGIAASGRKRLRFIWLRCLVVHQRIADSHYSGIPILGRSSPSFRPVPIPT